MRGREIENLMLGAAVVGFIIWNILWVVEFVYVRWKRRLK